MSESSWDEEYTIEEFTFLLPETKQRKKVCTPKSDNHHNGGTNPQIASTLCCVSKKGVVGDCLSKTDDTCHIL